MNNRIELFEDYINTHFSENATLDPKRLKLEFNTFDLNFKNHLPTNKDSKILEIGFGTGFFLKYLLDNGYTNFLGIELSEQEAEYVRTHISKNVQVVGDTKEYLEQHTNTFDLICMFDVLEHIPKTDVINMLKAIKNSLKEDGIFIARVPNGSNPFNIHLFVADFTHEFTYNRESLEQVNKIAKFSKVDVLAFKEENISTHSKLTNITAPIMYFILKILMGLGRSSYNSKDYFTRNIFCVCKK